MSEGIKETKEVLVAMNDLALELIAVLKDGVQIADAAALLAHIAVNEDLKNALFAAYDNISKVPAELGDLDAAEGIDLAIAQAQMVPKIVEALKKA